MTNEQLAGFIKQGGNDELIPILWGNVKNLLYMFADNYYRAYNDYLDRYGITEWDLKQQAYTAFLKAIEAYDENGEYKFTSYLKYPFKNAVRTLLTKDALNKSESLNTPVKSSEDSGNELELGDTIPDPLSLDFVKDIEDSDETAYIQRTVRSAVDNLPETEREVIQEHYFKRRTYKDIAKEKEKSIECIRQRTHKAIMHLKRNKDIRRLGDELGYTSQKSYNNSFSTFKRSGICGAERVAIERADIDTKLVRRNILLEKYNKLQDEFMSGKITQYEFTARMSSLLDES